MTTTQQAPFQLPEQPLELDIVAKYFRGFGDPTRLRILEALTDGERSVGELVELIEAPQPKVSAHLACLRWCGYVDGRREGKFVYYRITDPRIRHLVELARSVIADNAAAILSCTRM